MDFLSGGYYKATIHRVVQPPEDQRGHPRLGLFYFTMPDDDVLLVPHVESPVLQREGIKRRFDDAVAPTMGQWRRNRLSRVRETKFEVRPDGNEQEVIHGITLQYYN